MLQHEMAGERVKICDGMHLSRIYAGQKVPVSCQQKVTGNSRSIHRRMAVFRL